MAIQYYNNQFYNPVQPGMAGINNIAQTPYVPGLGMYANPVSGGGGQQQPPAPQGDNVFSNPFTTASSGGVQGTLQPYINRMTQNASNALYGGLLNYQPQSLVAGDAGGTPRNSKVPQWNLPSAIPTPNQGQIGLLGPQANNYQSLDQQQPVFGKRSWMEA
jgi:hypothetical protein